MIYGVVRGAVTSGVARVLSTRDAIDAVRYEESLLDFTSAFWAEIEPREFQSNWHIEAICEHLEAVANWQVDRLLINMPPRHMKSLAANVFFPAWLWAQDPNPDDEPGYGLQVRRDSWRGPGVKFMHLSYDSALSIRDGVKCRQIITSPKYQRLWGRRFQLRDDQNQKIRFDNLTGGHRLATSEGGVITGEGADIIIYDDPHNARDIGGSSSLARENTLRFWDEALPSRLNDQEHGAFVVIMQRLHQHDLSGHILAREQGWTHLCLPAVYEAKHPFPMRTSVVRKSTGEIWADPRKDGEVLWPAKFSRKALQRIAKGEAMTSHVAAGQLQQRPSALEGGLFKRNWFEHPLEIADYYAFAETKRLQLVRAWDLAWTAEDTGKDPDWTVGVLMGCDRESDLLYVLDVVRGRWSPAELERVVTSVAARDGTGCRVRIPQDPGAGTFVAAYLRDVLRRAGSYSVSIEREQTSKAQRAAPLAAQAENRFLVLLKGDWTAAFVNELCAFRPESKDNVDDQLDAAAAAFRALVRQPTFAGVGV